MLVTGNLMIKNTDLFQLSSSDRTRSVSQRVFVLSLDTRVLACVRTFTLCSVRACDSGEDPGFQGDLGRDPFLDHHHQHPDRTADISTRHLRSLEGNITQIFFKRIGQHFEKLKMCLNPSEALWWGRPQMLHRFLRDGAWFSRCSNSL